MNKKDIENQARTALARIKKTNPKYYKQLTTEYQLTPKIVAEYAHSFYEECNPQNEYRNFQDFLVKRFNIAPNPTQKKTQNTPLENYVDYLLGEQLYAVSTVNACLGMPILDRLLGIYRHGFIQIYDSPFNNNKNKNVKSEILELNPAAQTNEYQKGAKIFSQVRQVPGIVTLALHLSGKELLDTGKYSLKHYLPWRNDCQSFTGHAQEKMNTKLRHGNLTQPMINHHRYSPPFNKKDAQKMRKAFGVEASKRIFKMNEKGLDIDIPGQSLEDNFRNVQNNRNINESPIRGWYFYYPWVFMQFSKDIIDRFYHRALFKLAMRSAPKPLKKSISKIDEMDSQFRGLNNTILSDINKIPTKIKNANKEILVFSAQLAKDKYEFIDSLSILSSELAKHLSESNDKKIIKQIEILNGKIDKYDETLLHLNSNLEKLSNRDLDFMLTRLQQASADLKSMKNVANHLFNPESVEEDRTQRFSLPEKSREHLVKHVPKAKVRDKRENPALMRELKEELHKRQVKIYKKANR